MSTAYAGTDTCPATIPLPEDNVDKRKASVMNACFGPLMDFCLWLKNRLGAVRIVGGGVVEESTGDWVITDSITYGTDDYELLAFSVVASDIIDLDGVLHVHGDAVDYYADVRFAYSMGADPVGVGTVQVSSASVPLRSSAHYIAFPLSTTFVAPSTGTMHIWLQAKTSDHDHAVLVGAPGFVRYKQQRGNS